MEDQPQLESAWQAQVPKKPPLMGPHNLAGPMLFGTKHNSEEATRGRRTWQGQVLERHAPDGQSTRGTRKFGRNRPLWAKVLMGTHVWQAHVAGRSVAEPRL